MTKKRFTGRIRLMSTVKQTVFYIMIAVCSASTFAAAVKPIPEETGFSGQFRFGAAWGRVKSNMVAGSRFSELSRDRIGSLYGSPNSQSMLSPIFGGELRYTFADTRSQIFLTGDRGDPSDPFRFDQALALGVGKQWDDIGILEAAYLFEIGGTEVWEDPYIVGQKRHETDRTSTGARLSWGKVMDSNFHLTYSYRDIDVDHEQSGVFLGLPNAQQDLLSRKGDSHRAEVLYAHQLSENQWLTPALYYSHNDLDGDAMSNDAYALMLTHTVATQQFRLMTSLGYGFANYDRQNPIYSKTQKADRYGVSVTAIIPKFLKVENLTGMLTAAYWLKDANIDFYDSEVIAVMASTVYSF